MCVTATDYCKGYAAEYESEVIMRRLHWEYDLLMCVRVCLCSALFATSLFISPNLMLGW